MFYYFKFAYVSIYTKHETRYTTFSCTVFRSLLYSNCLKFFLLFLKSQVLSEARSRYRDRCRKDGETRLVKSRTESRVEQDESRNQQRERAFGRCLKRVLEIIGMSQSRLVTIATLTPQKRRAAHISRL